MTTIEITELTEQDLQKQIILIQKKRSKQLKESGNKIKHSYIYKTLLKMKKTTYFSKLETGKFTEAEVLKLKKHQLIKQ